MLGVGVFQRCEPSGEGFNRLTLKVVNASAATSNELLSIQSKNFQNTPLPPWGLSLAIPARP